VDVQKIQVGNWADQGRRGCWARMFEELASVEIGGGWCSLVNLGELKVDWKNVEPMDRGKGVESVRYP